MECIIVFKCEYNVLRCDTQVSQNLGGQYLLQIYFLELASVFYYAEEKLSTHVIKQDIHLRVKYPREQKVNTSTREALPGVMLQTDTIRLWF